jgi:hypothetical protein
VPISKCTAPCGKSAWVVRRSPVAILRPSPRVRRGGRVAEGARLESVYTGNRIVGSNPTPSARPSDKPVLRRSRCPEEASIFAGSALNLRSPTAWPASKNILFSLFFLRSSVLLRRGTVLRSLVNAMFCTTPGEADLESHSLGRKLESAVRILPTQPASRVSRAGFRGPEKPGRLRRFSNALIGLIAENLGEIQRSWGNFGRRSLATSFQFPL